MEEKNQNDELNQNKNQENAGDIQNEENYSFSRYKKPIKTGLKLIGESSYLNSVLFCLGNIRNIASYFLNPKNQSYINNNVGNNPLSYVFERLLIHFYPYPEKENKEIYEPTSLLKIISSLNVEFKTLQKRNPNDLIAFILNTLHEELNQNKNENLNLNENIHDKKSVINNSLKKFKNSENSIIYNNFNWFEIKELKCFDCGNKIYELRTFGTFSLNIQESYQKIKNQKNSITLYDCLEYYKFTKQQKLYCNNCKCQKALNITTNIFSSPNNFVFLLDRGIEFNDKNDSLKIPFVLCDKIELDNFIENEKAPKKYQLIGITSIYIKKKDYVSFGKSPVDQNWYYYNDETSKQLDINNIIQLHNNFKDFFPCILIYKAVK